MAVTAKHKKARIFRDYLISTNGMDMFKEEESEQVILFRSAYPITKEERKQFVIIFDDSVYTMMQALIIKEVPADKKAAILEAINELHREHPSVKYILTKDNQLMTSMVFHNHEKNIEPSLILRCTLEFFKGMAGKHYKHFMDIINE